MNSNKKIARIAGLLYLIVVVTGIISLAYVPSKLIVWNDASKTYTNIVDNEMLFRIGILCGLICYTTFVVLPIALYKLLNPVNNTYALLMVVLAVASVPVSLINIGNKFSVLTLIHKASELKGVKPGRIQEQVLFQLHLYNNGNQIASIFWGFGYYRLAI